MDIEKKRKMGPYIVFALSLLATILFSDFKNFQSNIKEIDFIVKSLSFLFLPVLIYKYLPLLTFLITTQVLKYLWKEKDRIINTIQTKDNEIVDFFTDKLKENSKALTPLRQKMPEELTTITFESLKYIEDNKKQLFEEKNLDSEYIKSFVHLNTSYYAATVFIIKEKTTNEQAKLLFIKDEGDDINNNKKNIKPLGGRMPKNGLPEKYIELIIKKNTGIVNTEYQYCTFSGHEIDYQGIIDDSTKVMKYPITIQLESNIQKDGVPYHLDFIYLVKLKPGNNSGLYRNGNLDPDWYSFSEVEEAISSDRFYYNSTRKLARLIIDFYSNGKIIIQD